MWCNLIKRFERALAINANHIFVKNTAVGLSFNYGHLQQRSLWHPSVLCNTESLQAARKRINEFDGEYIVPYNVEKEKRQFSRTVINALRTKFHLSEEDADQIMTDEVVSKSYRQKSLIDTMETLCAENVTKNQFIEYPWLITLDKNKLLQKIRILKTLNGFRDLNDFIPFLRFQVPRLHKLVCSLNRESNYIECGNRVYYLANQLNVPASTVTKYLAKRLFVLEMPWDMFNTNLQHMINYSVEPMSILKDLWGFRYAPAAVELRLKRAALAKKEKIMPWMVRCPEPILQKSLQISLDELKVLGDKSVAEYVGERLGFNAKEAQAIMNKHPQVNRVRVTKIKEIMDYLLDEAQFSKHEIAQVPRILCHSLETTKQRLEELKRYGCRPSSLVIVCRSKREYDKFLRKWINSYNPNKEIDQQKPEDDTT